MPVPPKRRSNSSKRRRAAHFALKHPSLHKCPKCGKDIVPHHACRFCGYYRGREIVKTMKEARPLAARLASDEPRRTKLTETKK